MDLNDAGVASLLGVAIVYLLRALRDDLSRWRQRANGGTSQERSVALLERIDHHLAEHRAEMARYQTSIAGLLGEIKGRLSR